MPLILPGNVGSATAATGYDVANSLRFNNGSSDRLTRTTTGSVTNADKVTFSAWVKRSGQINQNISIWGEYYDTNNRTEIGFNSTNDHFYIYGKDGGSTYVQVETNATFRDVSAWYHFVLAYDSTDGTAANRVKMYVNGVQITSFATATYPDQNTDIRLNSTNQGYSVGDAEAADHFWDGYMCEVAHVDGQQLAPTAFGEFDDDSGIWKPKDFKDDTTFGTNGYYLEFKQSGVGTNASGMGADTSGNDNHFAVNNLTAIDQSIDTCTNNFATLNGLDFYHNATANTHSTLTEGGLKFVIASGNKGFARSTFAVSAGKWYFEAETNAVGKGFYGVCHEGIMEDGTALQPSAVYYYEAVPDFRSGDQIITTNAVSVSAGDILGFALDMDNYALYISKNGTYMNSGNPGSGSSRTGAISEEFTNGRAVLSDYGPIFANVANTSTTGGLDAKVNFGSPFYSESGGNADGNGFGNFKTAPPSGYLAFCTKNLAETGG